MSALRFQEHPLRYPAGGDYFSDIHPDFQRLTPWEYAKANLLLMLKLSQGESFVPHALRGWQGNRYIDLIVGCGLWGLIGYHYADGWSMESARREADHFFAQLKRLGMVKDGMLPPTLDFEESKGIRDKTARGLWAREFSKRLRRQIARELLRQDAELRALRGRQRKRKLRAIGRAIRPTLYTGSFWRYLVAGGPFNFRLHLAAYTSSPYPYVPAVWNRTKALLARLFWFWQLTDRGTTRGIPTRHDRNRIMVSATRLHGMKIRLADYHPRG